MKFFLKRISLAILFISFLSNSIIAQNWVDGGFTPGQEISYDQDGNTLWKLTINNIYKSTDGGNSWTQNIDQANAPFYADDYFQSNFAITPIFDHRESRVHGDFMFLGIITGCCSASEFWTTPDAGLTFKKFEFEGDFFAESYSLGNNRYAIQTTQFDNTHPSFNRSRWYLSSDGGQNFNEVLFDYGRNARIVNHTNTTLIIQDEDMIHYHNAADFSFIRSVTLPERAWTGNVNGNIIQAISYEESRTGTGISLHVSQNGGASFTTINNTKAAGFIFDFSIIDNFLFFTVGTSLHRYDLNNFANAPTLFSTDVTPAGPFKKTIDGTMVNKEVVLFNGNEFTFNNPLHTSINHWSTTTPTPKVPYSLEALANFGSSYSRFYRTEAYTTTDGLDFQFADDFFGSALKDDIIQLENSMYISVYADPSSHAFFSNDGSNFTASDDLNGYDGTDADFFQAGDNIIAKPPRFSDPLTISTNNGNTWAEVPGSYAWGRYLFTDQVNGTLYGYQASFTPTNIVSMAKSIDNGVTWKFIDTNLPTIQDFNGQAGRPFMAYNNHIFLKNGNTLLKSSDGGLTFVPVDGLPNSFNNACVWINDGKLHVDTHDENIFTLDLDQWLGTAPAPTQAGFQIDLELSIHTVPENPAPFSNFDVVVTLENKGAHTANRINVTRPSFPSSNAVTQGGSSPTFSSNFDWNQGFNQEFNSLAPGESATATYPFFRLNGGELETEVWITTALQPDVDSRPGNIVPGNPEDDEAVYPNSDGPPDPTFNLNVICPSDFTITLENGQTTSTVFYDFGGRTTCPGGAVDISINGITNGSAVGPGVYPITITATDQCGNVESCSFNVTIIAPDGGGNGGGNGGGGNSTGLDLALSMTQSIANPAAYSTFTRTVTISNTGSVNVASVEVAIPLLDGMVFAGGSEWTATSGTYSHFNTQLWTLSNLAAGASEEIELTYFSLESISAPGYAQIFSNSGGQDIDSTPNNGNAPNVNEDDEANTNGDTGGGNEGGGNTGGGNTGGGTTTNGLDLELSMTQSVANPAAYSTFTRTVTITNAGTVNVPAVEVSIPLFDGMVFAGGSEWTATSGTYSHFNTQIWTLSNLAAGASEEIELTYFSLESISAPGYAQIFSNGGGQDVDSTPNNGTAPNVNEDDEANTNGEIGGGNTGGGNGNGGGNQNDLPDLTISNFFVGNEIVLNELTDFNFDLNNLGTATVSGDYMIELYLSTDNSLSSNDVFVGDILTGNTAPGTIPNVNGVLLASSFATGPQHLIVVVDVDNDVAESNESNNITVLNVNVVGVTTNDGTDLNLSVQLDGFNQPQYQTYSVTYTVANEGNANSSNVGIEIPIPVGVVYQGGDEFSTTKGDFSLFNELWSVGTLSPNETAELTINYFKIDAGRIQHYGQVATANGSDPDSTPGNGQCCIAVEDDEASIRTNAIQGRVASNNVIANGKMDVAPNPSSGERVVLRMNITAADATAKEIYIYDFMGRAVATQKESLSEGYNEVVLPTQDLPSGYYQVLIEDMNMRFVPVRFVIERL